MATKLLPISSTASVETEIDEKFIRNSDINREDIQVFVEISEGNLTPIKFGYNPDGSIHIEDQEEACAKNVYIGSKRQFIYYRMNIREDTHKLDINVEELMSAWNPKKYFVFHNGYLMNSSIMRIYIPSFDNTIARKVIYTTTTIRAKDRIDIFYIESEDYMSSIPINRDVYITTRKQYATMNYQTLFPIPYPYPEYPRGPKMFFVCDMEGHYLDNRYDYQIEVDNEHITLRDDHKVVSAYTDYLIYTFPYVKQDWENEGNSDEDIMSGNDSGVDIIYAHSILQSSNANGLISFYPIFDRYSIDKSNIILFCNSTFIEPDRYEIVDNGTIRLLNDIDRYHSVYAQYTMVIFQEQNVYDKDNLEFAIEVHQVEATEDQQQKFYIPNVQIQKPSFLVFVGSINFDQKYRFQWKQEINRMDIDDEEDFVEKGRLVTFIFYKPLLPKLIREKEIYFKKMQFDVPDDSGYVTIPSNLYNDIDFNPSNLLLFLNGTFLDPDRYNINKNIINMISPIDDGLDDTKTLVGIYLVAYKPNYATEGEGPYDYTDLKEDHDWIIFDEMYAVPYIPPHTDAYISDGGGFEYLKGDLTVWFFNGNPVTFEYKGGRFNEDGKNNKGLISGNFSYSRGTFNGSNQADGRGRISGNLNINRNDWNPNQDGVNRISGNLYNKQVDPPREFRIGISNGEQGRRRGFLSDGYSDGRDPFGWLSGGTKNFTIDGKTFSLYELSALSSSRNILEIKGSATFSQLIVTLSGTSFLFNLPNGRYGSCSDTQGMWNFFDSHVDQTLQITIRTP